MSQVRLNYTPYGGSPATLDLDILSVRGAAEPDEVEQFPDLKHQYLDGSLARQVKGGRRNIEIEFAVVSSALNRRKLVSFFLDPEMTLECLVATPTNLVGSLSAGGGSLTSGSTYLYKVAAIDAIGYSIASSQISTGAVPSTGYKEGLSWDAMTNAVLYKIFRKKDAEAWKVLDYSTTNSYLDLGTLTPFQTEDPPTAASVISVVTESNMLTSIWRGDFSGSPSYTIRFNEASIFTSDLLPF